MRSLPTIKAILAIGLIFHAIAGSVIGFEGGDPGPAKTSDRTPPEAPKGDDAQSPKENSTAQQNRNTAKITSDEAQPSKDMGAELKSILSGQDAHSSPYVHQRTQNVLDQAATSREFIEKVFEAKMITREQKYKILKSMGDSVTAGFNNTSGTPPPFDQSRKTRT